MKTYTKKELKVLGEISFDTGVMYAKDKVIKIIEEGEVISGRAIRENVKSNGNEYYLRQDKLIKLIKKIK
jgi:hypothetical protein